MRFRFLPIFMLIAALGVGVKFAGLWQSFSGLTPAFAAGDPATPDGSQPEAQGAADGGAGGDEGESMTKGPLDRPVSESQITNLSNDIFEMTDEELVLLQSLSQRREELEQRAREIDEREVLLKAAEQRIEQKITELELLQQSIEALLVTHDEQTEAQMLSLVKIYESMKPKDAARIFEELDMEVLLEVIERMKERKTAPILAQMNPQRAKVVTLELAQRRELPIPRN